MWIAASPDFAGKQLTTFVGDDGQDITSLTWSPDGKALLFVRGGGPNRQGEIPNPALTPDAAEQAIWALDIASGAARKLMTGSSPAISVNGDVAYLTRGQVWSTTLDPAAKPAQLFSIRGQPRDLKWSPDGTRLAFVSARGDHSFIGWYDRTAKAIRYLDPSVDLDGNPTWSPDGSRIVFTRTPATGEIFMFAPRREAQPWSIRVADVATSKANEIWKAQAGPGSVFQGVTAGAQLQWADDDRIVFPWEKDGWIHLYSVAARGGTAKLLTPGGFEVEHVALTPNRRRIVYSSNQDDIDRRHLWSVAVAGGAPTPLTRGPSSEWMPSPIDDSSVAFLRSDGRMPAHAAILTGTTQRALASTTMPADLPRQSTGRAAGGDVHRRRWHDHSWAGVRTRRHQKW